MEIPIKMNRISELVRKRFCRIYMYFSLADLFDEQILKKECIKLGLNIKCLNDIEVSGVVQVSLAIIPLEIVNINWIETEIRKRFKIALMMALKKSDNSKRIEEYLKKTDISPKFILEFINNFQEQSSLMTNTTPKQFKDIIRLKFKYMDKHKVYQNMVFSTENKTIFPFFMNIDNNLLISHNFIRLMSLFYYPFYYKELFNKKIKLNSDYFEKTLVPQKLSNCGFKVIPNYKDKKNASLEIDQIAWKGNTLYVIETKVWDIKPYFEHRTFHGQRERDLKGVVDGKEYSYVHGIEEIRDKPSLLEKIKHVKEKLSEICDNYSNIQKIIGVVITKNHPIINEYKEVKFIGFEKIISL